MKMRTIRNSKSQNGFVLAEFTAAIAVIVPLSLTLFVACWEANEVLLVKNSIAEAAKRGARNCAMAYHYPPYGSGLTATGTSGSADAQGPTVAPATESTGTPTAVVVTGTASGTQLSGGQPQTCNDAWGRVRIGHIVTSNTQFTAIYVPASINNTTYQNGHVTVTVTSLPGIVTTGDPLHIKGLLNTATISSSASYSLN